MILGNGGGSFNGNQNGNGNGIFNGNNNGSSISLLNHITSNFLF